MATRPDDVTLDCVPSREGGALSFAYRVANAGAAPIYLLDVLPAPDPAGGESEDAVVTAAAVWSVGASAVIRLGLPPATEGTAMPRIPLGFRVEPQQSAQRRLVLPLPFAERDPTVPDGPLSAYAQHDVAEVRFAVQFLRATAPGFAAAPDERGETLSRVWCRQLPRRVETLVTTFPTKGLTILRRRAEGPRPPLP